MPSYLGSITGSVLDQGGAVYNVRAYGAKGDGTTDDTTAIQSVLNLGGWCFLPAGTYKITSPLTINLASAYAGIKVTGAGRPSRNLTGTFTYIRQDTVNTPIFKFTGGFECASFEDFGVGYPAVSGTGNTAAIAFQFDQATNGGSPSWFHSDWERITVLNAYSGWAITSAGGQSASVWDCHWRSIVLDNIQNHCWSLASSTSIGQPISTWRDIGVNNANASVVSTGFIWNLQAVEAYMDGLDLEGWYNCILNCSGGYNVAARGIHVEHHVMDATQTFYYNMFVVQSAGMHMDITDISIAWASNGGGAYGITGIISASAGGATASIDRALITSPGGAVGQLNVYYGSSGRGRVGDVSNTGATTFVSPSADAPSAAVCLTVASTGILLPQSATAVAVATAGTIAVASTLSRVAPAGAVTGVILTAGTYPGQTVTVVNESAFSVTFAASGTSHVADGVSNVIAATTARGFVWDSGTSLWYRSA